MQDAKESWRAIGGDIYVTHSRGDGVAPILWPSKSHRRLTSTTPGPLPSPSGISLEAEGSGIHLFSKFSSRLSPFYGLSMFLCLRNLAPPPPSWRRQGDMVDLFSLWWFSWRWEWQCNYDVNNFLGMTIWILSFPNSDIKVKMMSPPWNNIL